MTENLENIMETYKEVVRVKHNGHNDYDQISSGTNVQTDEIIKKTGSGTITDPTHGTKRKSYKNNPIHGQELS